jgi:hypothetical protein
MDVQLGVSNLCETHFEGIPDHCADEKMDTSKIQEHQKNGENYINRRVIIFKFFINMGGAKYVARSGHTIIARSFYLDTLKRTKIYRKRIISKLNF